MSRTKKYNPDKMRKGVRRDILKEEGNVHLPPNKVEPTKKQYKRFRKQDIELEEEL